MFPTTEEAQSYANEEMTIEQWILERDRFISDKNTVNNFWCTQGIYLMAIHDLQTPVKGGIHFQVVVSMNNESTKIPKLRTHCLLLIINFVWGIILFRPCSMDMVRSCLL